MGTLFLASVLRPLTEKVGEVEKVEELLDMLEHCFVEAFKVTLANAQAEGRSRISPTNLSATLLPSIDAGEEAKLLVVQAVTAFHRNGAARHGSLFKSHRYHPHAALFLLELLRSLSGNSQNWFRQLQLDSLEACLTIVEVIGVDNVRRCLPGLVSVGVRYVHRAHHGKDSTKVCLTAVKLLRSALSISLGTAEPMAWVQEALEHLSNSLRAILEPAALVQSAHSISVVVELKQLITSILISPAVVGRLVTPLGSLLLVAYAIVENMDHLHRLGDDARDPNTRVLSDAEHRAETARVCALLGSRASTTAMEEALQCLRGVPLLHLATTVTRVPPLRDHFFPLRRPSSATALPSGGSDTFVTADTAEPTIALFSSVVRKCVRVAGTDMTEEALYTHRRPRKYPAGVVDEFLFCLAGALARLPNLTELTDDFMEVGEADETVGEQLTNWVLDEYEAVLRDWDAYAMHPASIYVLTRLVVWQFCPARACCAEEGTVDADGAIAPSCISPSAADLVDGPFEQLWSVVAQPHLWAITQDEELCNYQQVHHRQVVASTILRFLTLSAKVLSSSNDIPHREDAFRGTEKARQEALERLYTLTLYLVLEKMTANSIVREAALTCLEAYSMASQEREALSFLLSHSSLIVDETARAVRESHLRPAAASVLRGSLAFIQSHLTRSDSGDAKVAAFFGADVSGLATVVRQRLSVKTMTAYFERAMRNDVSLEEAAQVADFVASTIHVAREALQLTSRYDRAVSATEDAVGRRAAVFLLRDALDMTVFLNYCVPQEALDEEQERRTTSAHTRVRALQSVAVEAVYSVLQHCTLHDQVAVVAVQTVVRGLTCFLTTSTAVNWAERMRQRLLEEAAAQRRSAQRRRDRPSQKGLLKSEEGVASVIGDGEVTEREEADDEEATDTVVLPSAPPLDWPWTHFAPIEAEAGAEGKAASDPGRKEAHSAVTIQLPRSHLHTVYRVYLSLFALLREPMAAFATVSATPHARSGVERRKLSEVPITPAFFETLSGLEAIRILACDFLLHRMVEEVLPLVLLWRERATTIRIPTHTEDRAKEATRQFVLHLYEDCKDSAELQGSMLVKCSGTAILPTPEVVAR